MSFFKRHKTLHKSISKAHGNWLKAPWGPYWKHMQINLTYREACQSSDALKTVKRAAPLCVVNVNHTINQMTMYATESWWNEA